MFDVSKIIITQEMLKLIAEIDSFKAVWQNVQKLTPETLKELRKVATIESIGSSTRIEGSLLSDHDVEKLLSNLEMYQFASRDQQEVLGYAFVCEEIFQGFSSMGFSENLIQQLHGWLLKYSQKDERHRGSYKKFSNNVEAFDPTGASLGIVFATTNPFETPFKMQELFSWIIVHIEQKTLHPLLLIGIFIVTFLAIHPFQDGNGRLSRILTTLLLLQAGYVYVPYSSLESIIERSKDSYYLALRQTQQTLKLNQPDFGPWLLFFLRSLQKQKNHLEHKIAHAKSFLLHMPEVSAQIMTLLDKHGRLTISQFEKMSALNRNTLKKHVSNLVAGKHILRHGKGKSCWYTLP